MVKKKVSSGSNQVCSDCGMSQGRGWYFLKGIIAIVLGIVVWTEYVSLTQAVAILLVLVGVKHLLMPACGCRK